MGSPRFFFLKIPPPFSFVEEPWHWQGPTGMRSFVGNFALTLGFVALASAFHTPYRPEQSRHYDVTRTTTFKPITEKVKTMLFGSNVVRERHGARLLTDLSIAEHFSLRAAC
jgi:hypothetical protein